VTAVVVQGPVPQPPGQEVSVSGQLEGWDAVLLVLGVSCLLVVLLWPLIRAFARRLEQGGAGGEVLVELETLRERVRELESMPPRMAELEERLDFAERLLAQAREPDRLSK